MTNREKYVYAFLLRPLYCVKIDMFFNCKYKRRTPPINMSVRDEGVSVIAV